MMETVPTSVAVVLILTNVLFAVLADHWRRAANRERAEVQKAETEAQLGYQQIRADALTEAKRAYETSDAYREGYNRGYAAGWRETLEVTSEMDAMRQSGALLERTV